MESYKELHPLMRMLAWFFWPFGTIINLGGSEAQIACIFGFAFGSLAARHAINGPTLGLMCGFVYLLGVLNTAYLMETSTDDDARKALVFGLAGILLGMVFAPVLFV